MKRKIVLKFFVLCVLSAAALFIMENSAKADNCELELQDCLYYATTQQERNECYVDYNFCVLGGGGSGPGGNGPDNCPQVQSDRQSCADQYPGIENRQAYCECYGMIPNNNQCLGYEPC